MPVQQFVEVGKGDFGSKFQVIGGVAGASNRPVNRNRVSDYGKNIGALAVSHLTLIERDGASYYIADGQHRICAISARANGTPVKMPATIYTVAEIESGGRSVAQFISDLNRGKAFTASDRLAVFQEESTWPDVFADRGIYPRHANSKANGFPWGSIIRARIYADSMARKGSLVAPAGNEAGPSALERAWHDYPDGGIHETADALLWWTVAAEAARTQRRVTALYRVDALTLAFLLWRQNRDMRDGCARAREAFLGIAENVVRDPALAALASVKGTQFYYALLRSLNYRRAGHFLVAFGRNGREE